jgi:UPF0042 nucleotide-binding protein
MQSFGFKHGLPLDADFVFDARCLPNPYWNPKLRGFTGKDQPVIDFLNSESIVTEFFQDISGLLERWIPRFEKILIASFNGKFKSVSGCRRLVSL